MNFRDTYTTNKNAYTSITNQKDTTKQNITNLYQHGGTFSGLLPDDIDALTRNCDFLSLDPNHIALNNNLHSLNDLSQLLLTVFTSPELATNILIDGLFTAFLFKNMAIKISEEQHTMPSIDDTASAFRNLCKSCSEISTKKIKMLFDSSQIANVEFGTSRQRKSKYLYVLREATSILEYSSPIVDEIRGEIIPLFKSIVKDEFPSLYNETTGEGDFDCFRIGDEICKADGTTYSVISVDGDLVFGMIFRKVFNRSPTYIKNVLIVRPTIAQFTHARIISIDGLGKNTIQTYAIKLLLALIFTNTDAGFGRHFRIPDPQDKRPQNTNEMNITKCYDSVIQDMPTPTIIPQQTPPNQNNMAHVICKFLGTLSILLFGWGLDKQTVYNFITSVFGIQNDVVLANLNGTVAKFLDEFNNVTKGQMLCSPFYFSTDDIIPFFGKLYTILTNGTSNELNYMIKFEFLLSLITNISKFYKIKPSLLLFINTHLPLDVIENFIYCMYQLKSANDFIYLCHKIGEDTLSNASLFDGFRFMYEKNSLFIGAKRVSKFIPEIKVMYIDVDYLEKVLQVLVYLCVTNQSFPSLIQHPTDAQMHNLEYLENYQWYKYGIHKGIICGYNPCKNMPLCKAKHLTEQREYCKCGYKLFPENTANTQIVRPCIKTHHPNVRCRFCHATKHIHRQ